MLPPCAGRPFLDLLCLAVEPPPKAGVPLSCFPLGSDHSPLSVTPAQVTCLRQEVFTKGQVGGGSQNRRDLLPLVVTTIQHSMNIAH